MEPQCSHEHSEAGWYRAVEAPQPLTRTARVGLALLDPLDDESDDRCRVGGEEAVLVLFAPDYDGGHKAWVRWTETGRDDIVPGSAVERD